ncbi:hypothetical protein ABH940_006777 [Streptacidiphilus sp. BW17]
MPAEGDLDQRAEVAHPEASAFLVAFGDEGALGVPHLSRYREHVGVRDAAGIQHDAGGVAARGIGRERRVAQDITGETHGSGHASKIPRGSDKINERFEEAERQQGDPGTRHLPVGGQVVAGRNGFGIRSPFM